ncbi:hypothetical protein M7I_7665 [Glarea lozoyensis 74030]|uniref:Uncharacterized protein n=1 Tax=Glarea lozoyensis (strain ATCC 74030 / MF5533) TaxID=1104152 RepID=H0EXX2_GLAL7|nr:hypothetical protein M7I_7665 [Glarea lozoyensis 74030]
MGLTVNHSGLNKYTTATDPNLIKIAEVLAKMVKPAMSKDEPCKLAAATTTLTRPWEAAAALVNKVDKAFDNMIKHLQARTVNPRETDTLIIQKYRLQSWAYAVGLISLLGARQPLHEQLDGTVCSAVREILEHIADTLDIDRQYRDSQELVSKPRALVSVAQESFDQLRSLFPEGDRAVMNHAFLNKCLEQDNDEIDLSDEVSTRSYASLEVTSAMKRIMILELSYQIHREIQMAQRSSASLQWYSRRMEAISRLLEH